MDIRENASRIYDEVFREFSFLLDQNRDIQRSWIDGARARQHKLQQDLITDLEEKVKYASDTVSDEFMYQDKAEAERELAAAKRLLEDMASPLSEERYRERSWNQTRYERYRGTDSEDDAEG